MNIYRFGAMYRSLRDYIVELERRGELLRVAAKVSPRFEIAEITDRMAKSEGGAKALLFENTGTELPVITNMMGSDSLMALDLGEERLDDIADRITALLGEALTPKGSLMDKLRALPLLAEMSRWFPQQVSGRGACQHTVYRDAEVDLCRLPMLQSWECDGGAFVTLPMVHTVDPDTGVRNVGMYRMQRFDAHTTGMHWHLHKDGASNYRAYKEMGMDKIEVAVAIGTDPVVTYSATAPLPRDIDEMVFAGFLRKKSVEMVKCKTVDVEVPATSEIVLEGYVNIGETRREGPFGDHTGYYSLADDYPVFHITCITHRKNPIYAATIVGKPPMEDCYLAKATERIFLPLLQQAIPEIRDINFPLEGVFHDCVMVSIKKTYPQQAKKVMHALWGMGQMMFTKLIIVVDEHVDVQNEKEVWWRVYNNIDAKHDLVMVDGPLDALDHSSPMAKWGTKIGIDATKTWPEEGHTREWPDEITMTDDIKKIVDNKWKELGLE